MPDRYTFSSMQWTCANATERNVQRALEDELLHGVCLAGWGSTMGSCDG
jgi:hypothetical protein